MAFLRDVSTDLLQRFGNNLSHVTVVFPGKRARLFMNQYLAEESPQPVWAPAYQTIDELVQQISPYRKADTIASVCQLYSIYSRLVPDAEPLDEFYSWGEIILSDFDDIDKHMAPADKIFRNVYDLHSISTDYLTPEQEQALREFFLNFSIEGNSELKQRFLRLWDIMPDLYRQLNEELESQGRLYSGAQYRQVAESLKAGTCASPDAPLSDPDRTYVFVGFNILDESTDALFRHFQQTHHALFYWDYDQFYVKDPIWEAGLFITDNLRRYPNALSEDHFDNLSRLQDITFIATSTNNAQSRYIPTWLDAHLTDTENETAIVLADEHQLGSVLHSIPEETPRHINITMGYPLSDTPVFSYVNVLMSMYIEGYDVAANKYRRTNYEKVCRHPYHAYSDETLSIPCPMDSPLLLQRLIAAVDNVSRHYANKVETDVYDQLYTEALFQTHLILTRFLQLTTTQDQGDGASPVLQVEPTTLRRLLFQIFSSTNIPFHGEPAIGMQVMGLLETRNIDFRHILMLNVGEGILPKRSEDNSLIPHNLRESFGLTTMRHRISVFAYYFYRLISRAEHLTLLYNETSSGATSNEMSRFMRQLMAETNLPIRYVRLMPSNQIREVPNSLIVNKTEDIVNQLRQTYLEGEKRKVLSPTAINSYLKCPLLFYYRYVAKIRIPDKPEDGITPPLFGIIFHDSAQLFYDHYRQHYGMQVTHEQLTRILETPDTRLYPFLSLSMLINYFRIIEDDEQKDREMKRIAQLSYSEIAEMVDDFYHAPANIGLLTGLNHIIHSVLRQYLLHLVQYDLTHTPFTLEGLEEDHYFTLALGPDQEILTGGRIDRLERDSHGRLTVVDYKTGKQAEPINGIEKIFQHDKPNAGYFLQTFIYALAVQQHGHNPSSGLLPEPVCPTLMYVNRINQPEKYERLLRIGTATKSEPVLDISTYSTEFLDRLTQTVRDIFNPDITFASTDNEKACKNCDFKLLCGK